MGSFVVVDPELDGSAADSSSRSLHARSPLRERSTI